MYKRRLAYSVNNKNFSLNKSTTTKVRTKKAKQKHLGCKKVQGQEADESATKSSDIR